MLRNTDPDRNNVITRFNRNSIGRQQMKQVTVVYFSPTGNTKKSLEAMGEALGGIDERVATLTVNDSISTYDIKVTQSVNGVSAVEAVSQAPVTLCPSIFDQEVTVQLPEDSRRLMVVDEKGRELYSRELSDVERQVTVDASGWAPGTCFFRVLGNREVTVVKGVKR